VVELVPSQTWSNPRELLYDFRNKTFGMRPPFLTAASSTSFAMAAMVVTLASFAALNAALDNIIKGLGAKFFASHLCNSRLLVIVFTINEEKESHVETCIA
jgi:hypothetical protein